MSIIRKEQLTNPLSASYATTASYALNANITFNTSSLVTTSSFNTYTASINSFTSSINTFTSSYSTGSFTGSFTGSLLGTSSWAQNSNSSSYAITASYLLNAPTFDTGSLVTTSSFNAFTASINDFTSSYNTGSFTGSFIGDLSGTASYALNTTPPFPYTGSARITGSLDIIGSTTVTGSFNVSGSTIQVGDNTLLGNTLLTGSITISGSVAALADISMSGVLRLDPTNDPGPSNLTASYLFTSASNTQQGFDLYYRQDGNIVKFKWLEGGLSTGLLYGGIVSGSGQTIYISSGSGIIMTSNAGYNQEINPIYTYITWGNYSASATYLTSSQNTYIYVDDSGNIQQQPGYFTEQQYQESICLGRVTHANYTNITGIGSNVQTTYDSDAQQSEFIRAFGPIKINGLTVTGQSGTLRINVGAGTSYNLGGFYSSNASHPSSYNSTATVTGSMARAYRSGSGIYLDNNGGAFYTVIDPTKYDDGSGVLQNTGTGNWTIQRLFYNPESKRSTIYYGQSRYTTLLNALQYLSTDPFEEGEFTAKSLIFVAYLVVKGNTTDLTDSQNSIVQAGLFRNTTGGSGAAGSVTLALENLSDVNITSPVNGQALVYNSGVWINNNPTSSSYATTSSYINPLNQNVEITGSVLVSGSSIIFSGSQFEISNNIIINPNNRLLRSGSITSIDWGVRKLLTSVGGNSIDWTNKYTYGNEGLISINYGSRDLIDSVGSASLGWGGRTLLTTDGFPALDWNSNFISFSETYINRLYKQETQSSLASSIQYSGELINAAVSGSATQYNLISLSSSIWIPTRQTDENSTKMLGIALNVAENITKGVILLNGDISFDGTEGPVIHPGVTNDDIGKPVYIRNGGANMSLIPPTSGYVRIIGYVYYVDGSTYILRFNPSNNWYKLS